MHRRSPHTRLPGTRTAQAGHARLALALALGGVGLTAWWSMADERAAAPQALAPAHAPAGDQAMTRTAATSHDDTRLAATQTSARLSASSATAQPAGGETNAVVTSLNDTPSGQATPHLDAQAQAAATEPAAAAQASLTPQQWAAAALMPTPRLPTLHVVPVSTPSDADAINPGSSAGLPAASASVQDTEFQAAATATSSKVYTPAQIRQAYGLGGLPAATTANKGAYQGSGQMIVIINAYHNAAAGANLNTFSTKFGLPACTLLPSTYKAGATLASMVTAPKAGDGCSFQTVYVSATGAVVGTPPATNASWATEIDLDVQWAHAIAPHAKIVLIEAASASGTAIAAAMQLASQLGASAISMSYGATEYPQVTQLDAVLAGKATWVGASGDNGVQVSWPAASPSALAVGGTLLSTVSPRAETGWSGSGGGLSIYEKMPAFQNSVTIPGNLANTAANAGKLRRGVPDVAYNASPLSGHYLYTNGGWYSVGGTSAGTPQWAALVAVTNAVRVLNGKAAFTGTGFQHGVYGAAAASTYRSNYLDITVGSNGTCATCKTLTGYDLVTGLGSPNVAALLPALVALK